MSLETRIPKEICDYREKIVFGLSARQLASLGAAVAVVGLTALVLYYLLGIDLKVVEYVLITEAMPIIAVGFIRYKGLSFEDYARVRLNHRFGAKRLLNKTDLDSLTSLYPITPQAPVRYRRGADSHAVPEKEKRRRRKRQRECLQGREGKRRRSRRRRRRPRAS